jgi:hypothetical protein
MNSTESSAAEEKYFDILIIDLCAERERGGGGGDRAVRDWTKRSGTQCDNLIESRKDELGRASLFFHPFD